MTNFDQRPVPPKIISGCDCFLTKQFFSRVLLQRISQLFCQKIIASGYYFLVKLASGHKNVSSFVMILDELSNAVYRFALRCAGAENGGGGGVQTTFSRSWKIQRLSRARFNPRPAGVFSRTRPAGGGRFCPPCLTPELIGAARRARRRSKALNEKIPMHIKKNSLRGHM